MKDKILDYLKAYKDVINSKTELPGQIYFYGDDVIAIPRDDGDCRYPYGKDGFNYWTYASGYIHCNEGLFSPFLRATEGGEPKISFFVGHKEEGRVVEKQSILSVPIMRDEPSDLIRFSVFAKDATYYISESPKLISAIRTFVKDRRMFYSLIIINKTDKALDIFTSSYFNPFLKNALIENSTDRWFRQIEYSNESNLGTFKLETYEEKDRGIMSTNYGLLRCISSNTEYNENPIKEYQATTSRYEYVGGSRSSLHSARAIQEGFLSNENLSTSFTETAICGDLIDVHLEDVFSLDYVFTYTKEKSEFDQELSRTYTPNYVSEEFLSLEKVEDLNNSDIELKIEFKDSIVGDTLQANNFNPFMKHLKKQVEFCSEIKGFVQLSNFSLIGIRDIFQSIEGYMFDQPFKAKAKMLEALSFTSPNGRLPRQYSLPKAEGALPVMDLRPFIDQGVWVISTILTYIRLTKDYSFLSESCGYYNIVDEHKHIVTKSDLEDSVLEHMLKIMDYLLINRDQELSKCVLALYGDWNDALDGLGKSIDSSKEYGSGVSVMATLQVYQNLDEMIELLEAFESEKLLDKGQVDNLLNEYKIAKDEIKEGLFTYAIDKDKLLHGWGDKRSYLVGSHKDPDGWSRDGITSNAFWILSGLIKEDNVGLRKEMILKAYQRLNSKFGMKTFEPYFEKGTLGVGRIPNLPKGTAENGATYIHASMFGVMSLFAIGEGKLAWEELLKLIPLTHKNISVSPYVMPNSYGDNETFNIDGESMQDWQTGSSNVMLKTIIRYVVGFEPASHGIYIQPSSYQVFGQQEMVIKYLGKKLTIIHEAQNGSEFNNRQFTINGKTYLGEFDEIMNMKRLFIEDKVLLELGKEIIIKVQD